MDEYVLRLREDMPPGFLKNDHVPELPAARDYLVSLEGRRFKSEDQFRETLACFPDYLKEKEVPLGVDREVRRGIFLFDEGVVGTHNDTLSGRCEFGRLERIV